MCDAPFMKYESIHFTNLVLINLFVILCVSKSFWKENLRPEIAKWIKMVKKIKLVVKHCIMVDVNVTRHKCRVPLEADEWILAWTSKSGPSWNCSKTSSSASSGTRHLCLVTLTSNHYAVFSTELNLLDHLYSFSYFRT